MSSKTVVVCEFVDVMNKKIFKLLKLFLHIDWAPIINIIKIQFFFIHIFTIYIYIQYKQIKYFGVFKVLPTFQYTYNHFIQMKNVSFITLKYFFKNL